MIKFSFSFRKNTAKYLESDAVKSVLETGIAWLAEGMFSFFAE